MISILFGVEEVGQRDVFYVRGRKGASRRNGRGNHIIEEGGGIVYLDGVRVRKKKRPDL